MGLLQNRTCKQTLTCQKLNISVIQRGSDS